MTRVDIATDLNSEDETGFVWNATKTRRQPAIDDPRTGEKHRSRRAWWVTFCATLVLGTVPLVVALAGLREAHLYRQSSGEGLKFAVVSFLLMVANGLLGRAAFAVVRLSSYASNATRRRAFLAIAVLLVLAVVAADVVFVWVESHDRRCVGTCG